MILVLEPEIAVAVIVIEGKKKKGKQHRQKQMLNIHNSLLLKTPSNSPSSMSAFFLLHLLSLSFEGNFRAFFVAKEISSDSTPSPCPSEVCCARVMLESLC